MAFALAALLCFAVAYGLAMSEERLHVRKSVPVLVAAGLIWILVGVAYAQQGASAAAADAARHTILEFGGIDSIINTAAIFPVGTGPGGRLTEAQWNTTFLVNVTGNFLLAQEAKAIFEDQKLPSTMVLTSSATRSRSRLRAPAWMRGVPGRSTITLVQPRALGTTKSLEGLSPT